jgi:hypothetical protein
MPHASSFFDLIVLFHDGFAGERAAIFFFLNFGATGE